MSSTGKILSIIIPIYNAENTIERCLSSIISQMNQKVEVLLIDDGSTDHSLAIITRFSIKFPNIIIKNQNNGGVSFARNMGLGLAQGDWVWFIDADDTIAENSINSILNIVQSDQSKIDCLMFGYNNWLNEDYSCDYKGEHKELLLDKVEAIKNLYRSQFYNYQGFVWSKCFRRNIIVDNNLKFETQIYFNEDGLFCCSYFNIMRNDLLYITTPFYNYKIHNESAMQRLSEQYNPNFFTEIDAYEKMEEFTNSYEDKELRRLSRLGLLKSAINNFKLLKKFGRYEGNKKLKIQSIVRNKFHLVDFIKSHRKLLPECIKYFITQN